MPEPLIPSFPRFQAGIHLAFLVPDPSDSNEPLDGLSLPVSRFQKRRRNRRDRRLLDEPPLQWYLLPVKHHHEKRVSNRLAARGIERFLPTVTRLAQWGDRKKKISEPLFPGCCFARFAWKDRLAVLALPGVMYSATHRPLPIPMDELAMLKRLGESGLAVEPFAWGSEGRQVTVVRGPLAGMRGSLVQEGEYHRSIVRISCLDQSFAMPGAVEDVTSI